MFDKQETPRGIKSQESAPAKGNETKGRYCT